ncbi:Plug domain-containing protein [Mucilaginibacter boryungensis]
MKLFFEKVYIHTDRALYAPGEDLWFKAYVINARDNHLIGTSKNLYVELIAPGDSIVSKEIVYLEDGIAKGDFSIKPKLPAGNYRLRAYTNWMRNFGDNFIFEKPVTITGNTEATGKRAVTSIQAEKNRTSTSILSQPALRFFPEGGSLVNEISSIVAVRAENAQGKGIPAAGAIISAAGDTVAHFSCDSLGMGAFALLPFAGQSYHGTIKYQGQNITAQLPAALANGLALKIAKKDTLLYITISCDKATAASLAGKPFTLSAKHAGSTVIDQQIQLTGNQVSVKIPQDILPEGIAAFTLYDDQHKPNCERLIYIDRSTNTVKFAIGLDKPVYKPRERVNVNIKITDAKNHPVNGNLSVAVVDAGLNPVERSNIAAYFMLQSEIKGNIEHAERYFDTTNINRVKQLDLLLLTQGWRDFVWKRLADAPINISYLPEQGFTLNGRVKKESNKAPVAAANVTLSAPRASGQKLFFTQTDASGNYYFDNLQLFGEQNVRVSTRDVKGEANGIIELDSLATHSLSVNKAGVKSNQDVNPQLIAEVARRAPLIKGLDSVTNLKEVKIRGTHNITLRDQIAVTSGYPDEVLNVKADDLTFKSLKAYILYASKQAKPDPNGDNIVFFADGHTYKPRIIVDNTEVPFTDEDDADILEHYYNSYLNLPMNVVEKVVIKRLMAGLKAPKIGGNQQANIMGNTVLGAKSGGINFIFIIYLTLKPGALQKNNGGITTANIQGYYEARTFYKPIHNSTGFDSSKPDMRNTIHWEPMVKTDATGSAKVSFYNADPKTTVRVIVQGVTDTGEPVNAVKNYVVK